MIGKLFASKGASALLVALLPGTVAALMAHGLGRVFSGVLPDPTPRHLPAGTREGLTPSEPGVTA